MNEITPELLAQARMAKSATELMDLAEANGIALEEKAAEKIFKEFHSEKDNLTEEELDSVSGGGCHGSDEECETLLKDGCPEYWSEMFNKK